MMEKGLVFDIKRFAVHDGEGIRTTIFLKGCPLRCLWCHNPESFALERQMWHVRSRCIGCGECVKVCPSGALALQNGGIDFRADRCVACGKCAIACPTRAQQWDSEWMTVEEVVRAALRDAIPYALSGGGVTLSGGEPTYSQRAFALEILRALKERGISTAIESCMAADWEDVKRFLPLVDEFIVDVKLIDPEKHLAYTGGDNAEILENIRRLARVRPLLVRTPMIQGHTDDLENLAAIADFLASLDAPHGLRAELLNFNPLYSQKYLRRGMRVAEMGEKLTRRQMEDRRRLYEERGIPCIAT